MKGAAIGAALFVAGIFGMGIAVGVLAEAYHIQVLSEHTPTSHVQPIGITIDLGNGKTVTEWCFEPASKFECMDAARLSVYKLVYGDILVKKEKPQPAKKEK